ncbi:MAG: type I restriction enzyme HsdR N-terminal domain-containing protein [Pseudomonadota bacterium]|nr:type I restriction enzyme HsdR N-terminal domain-containing protein [Pseudomonadota bacterium]
MDGGKSAPEEIVRQLWVYKLMHTYGYKAEEIDLEKSVQFGTEIGTKAADIIVYADSAKITPKIIVECKKPKRKDDIEQLKSYMNAKGAPVAVWSNGADSIKEALENRPQPVVEFRKALDPEITFDRINDLFHKACDEWLGVFRPGEDIELAKRHLQVCVGPIEGVRLTGSNLRIMDDAFEYLLPIEAKKKKGQFFTLRHVVEMCVRMLNRTRREYVMDPACGSGGFLLHAMDWCYPATDNDQREQRKYRYAAKYLWGIDFEQRAAKTSHALMLIARDCHTNILGPDVSSLDPRTWYETGSGQALMDGLRQARVTARKIPEHEPLTDDDAERDIPEWLRAK